MIVNQLEGIRRRPHIFFGKNDVDGFDLLREIMTDVKKITGFKCVIHDDDIFLIHSDADWITEHYGSHEDFLNTFAFPDTEGIHYGILVHAFAKIIATVTGDVLVNWKGHFKSDGTEALLRKHSLAEEGFYFIFSV